MFFCMTCRQNTSCWNGNWSHLLRHKSFIWTIQWKSYVSWFTGYCPLQIHSTRPHGEQRKWISISFVAYKVQLKEMSWKMGNQKLVCCMAVCQHIDPSWSTCLENSYHLAPADFYINWFWKENNTTMLLTWLLKQWSSSRKFIRMGYRNVFRNFMNAGQRCLLWRTRNINLFNVQTVT